MNSSIISFFIFFCSDIFDTIEVIPAPKLDPILIIKNCNGITNPI